MQYYPFDSRKKLYREHIGAAAAGESLLLRVLIHKDARCDSVFLRFRSDSEENMRELPMAPREWLGDYRFYDCSISLDTGLYWYDFRYTSAYGQFFIVKTETSLGIVSEKEGGLWQQTVYDADFKTPEWLRGGIIYQIFPDRFYCSGKPKQDVPDDRFLCSDWSRKPEYRQNGEKCSLGNDYYGGDLNGIAEKLPYLAELGVTCIYLNPIFEAHSNHRYNTADYEKIDPLLGSEEDFKELCAAAGKYGIHIMLDGVFSHTGDDSRYFNRRGRYNECGAYQSADSRYYSWYKFSNFPDSYAAWWGIDTLPETNEEDFSFSGYITGENGILRRWLRCGADGWRLDVADELPDEFLDKIRAAVKAEKPDAFLLGEVWEDASNKISYGSRRRFLQGAQLDSVMNYPFSGAILDFVRGGSGNTFNETVCSLLENYPPAAAALMMNHIGTHDTPRALTVLAKGYPNGADREWQARQTLSKQEYTAAARLLKLAAVLQYTLPGVPSVYYGDEAGMQGYGDPFCRAAFPWGGNDKKLTEFYISLGKFRRKSEALRGTEYIPFEISDGFVSFERTGGKERIFVAVNPSESEYKTVLPDGYSEAETVFGKAPKGGISVIGAKDFIVLRAKREKNSRKN